MKYLYNESENKIAEDFEKATTDSYEAPATRSGTVIKKYVNVRRFPSRNGEVLGRVQMNDELEILGQEDGYYRIKYKNHPDAYIAEQFVEEVMK